jgi:hypothetical protein
MLKTGHVYAPKPTKREFMLSSSSSSQKLGNFSRYLNTCLIQIPIGATTTTSNIYYK